MSWGGGFTGIKVEKDESDTAPKIKVEDVGIRAMRSKTEDGMVPPSKRRASDSPLCPRPSKQPRYARDIIVVKVGGVSFERFYVHDALLKQNSKFLAALVDNTQKQLFLTTEISLQEAEPAAFSLYMSWLYDRTFPIRSKEISEMDYADHAAEWTALSSFYAIAVKLEDLDCCDAIMEAMVEKIEEKDGQGRLWYPADHNIMTLYDGTVKGSPVRDFLLDAYLHAPGTTASLISHDDELNHVGFLADLTRALLSQHSTNAPGNHLSSQKQSILYGG